MIARAGIVNACILALSGLLSACATPQAPPAEPQLPGPNPAPSSPPADEVSLVTPPPAGADEFYFRAEYGPPDFVREEAESQLWRYDGSDCSLFVFLYRESESYVLRHAETDPPGADGVIDTACLASIKNALRPSS